MATPPLQSKSVQAKAPTPSELEEARDTAEEIFCLMAGLYQSDMFGERQQLAIRAVSRLMKIHLDNLGDLTERAYDANRASRAENVAEFPSPS